MNENFAEWLKEEHPSSFLSTTPRALFFRNLAMAYPELLSILLNTDEAAAETITRVKEALRVLCLEVEAAEIGEEPVHTMLREWHLPPLLECLAFGEDDSARIELGRLMQLLGPCTVQAVTTSATVPDQAPAANSPDEAVQMTGRRTLVTAFSEWPLTDAGGGNPTVQPLHSSGVVSQPSMVSQPGTVFQTTTAGTSNDYLSVFPSPSGRPAEGTIRMSTSTPPSDAEIHERHKAQWMNRYLELTEILTQAAELTQRMGRVALEEVATHRMGPVALDEVAISPSMAPASRPPHRPDRPYRAAFHETQHQPQYAPPTLSPSLLPQEVSLARPLVNVSPAVTSPPPPPPPPPREQPQASSMQRPHANARPITPARTSFSAVGF